MFVVFHLATIAALRIPFVNTQLEGMIEGAFLNWIKMGLGYPLVVSYCGRVDDYFINSFCVVLWTLYQFFQHPYDRQTNANILSNPCICIYPSSLHTVCTCGQTNANSPLAKCSVGCFVSLNSNGYRTCASTGNGNQFGFLRKVLYGDFFTLNIIIKGFIPCHSHRRNHKVGRRWVLKCVQSTSLQNSN